MSAERSKQFILTVCNRWHDRAIGTLTYTEIDDLLCEIRDGIKKGKRRRAAPYAANRVHAHLGTMFRWAKRTKRLTENPMADMPKPRKAEPRSRPWFEGEAADAAIVKVWQAADTIGGDAGRLIKLITITGKRRGAIQAMQWEQIQTDWFWKLPKPKGNKRLHSIPLPRLAQRILSPRGDGRVLRRIDAQFLMNKVRALTGLDTFIFHGLRHMVESKLAELRVQPHVRDKLLDHSPKRGTGAQYDHWEYRDEMAEALEKWCSYIERLVAPAEGVAVLR